MTIGFVNDTDDVDVVDGASSVEAYTVETATFTIVEDTKYQVNAGASAIDMTLPDPTATGLLTIIHVSNPNNQLIKLIESANAGIYIKDIATAGTGSDYLYTEASEAFVGLVSFEVSGTKSWMVQGLSGAWRRGVNTNFISSIGDHGDLTGVSPYSTSDYGLWGNEEQSNLTVGSDIVLASGKIHNFKKISFQGAYKITFEDTDGYGRGAWIRAEEIDFGGFAASIIYDERDVSDIYTNTFVAPFYVFSKTISNAALAEIVSTSGYDAYGVSNTESNTNNISTPVSAVPSGIGQIPYFQINTHPTAGAPGLVDASTSTAGVAGGTGGDYTLDNGFYASLIATIPLQNMRIDSHFVDGTIIGVDSTTGSDASATGSGGHGGYPPNANGGATGGFNQVTNAGGNATVRGGNSGVGGGLFVLITESDISSLTVQARGGRGGNGYAGNNSVAASGGGGGGGGILLVRAANNSTTNYSAPGGLAGAANNGSSFNNTSSSAGGVGDVTLI